MTEDETVIYTAPTPPYVVQQFEPNGSYTVVSETQFVTCGTWLDIKGFLHEANAREYADEEKRENPATDYRVVKTGV